MSPYIRSASAYFADFAQCHLHAGYRYAEQRESNRPFAAVSAIRSSHSTEHLRDHPQDFLTSFVGVAESTGWSF
jgi:hypothetical protein